MKNGYQLGFLFVVIAWLMSPGATLGAGGMTGAQEPSGGGGYPVVTSKKGLQVELVDDALSLGIKHATFNVNLCGLIDPVGHADNLKWVMNGRKFYFRKAPIERLDQKIKRMSENGILVHLIILTYLSSDQNVNRIMIHPRCDKSPPNRLGAFNSATDEGRMWLRATLEFFANRWSAADQGFGRVVGYIMGNEVNSHWWWSNMGRVTLEEFTTDYLSAVRTAHQAIRQQSSWARVYISLEHHWNIRYPAGDQMQSFPGREFLVLFAKRARESGDFDWHLAFHPYPENLFEPRFWNDKTALDHPETPRITFKNLRVLTDFMQRAEMKHRDLPRRVILSEQGFHTPQGPQGQVVQAAAYCYAYKKVEALEGIDAFILHRHVDHDGEGGLLLGLRGNRPQNGERYPKKRIYECFRKADTPQWQDAFEFALPIIGIENWNSDSSTLTKPAD